MNPNMDTSLIPQLGDELYAALRECRTLAPLTDRHPEIGIDDAYHISLHMLERRLADGERVVGKKIGVTSKPVQDMLNVHQPDFGFLTDAMQHADGTSIYRSQDNFVVQFGDAEADDAGKAKPLGSAKTHLPAEFQRSAKGLNFTALPDHDGWTQTAGVRTGGGYGFTLRIGDAEAIAELDDVVSVAPVHQGTQQLVYGSRNWNASVVGTTPSYLDARSWALTSGYLFDDDDVRSATRVALIGKTVVENLFDPGENPVGKTIRVRNTPFEVIGTLAPKGQNLDGRDQDDTIIIPLSTAQRKVFGVPFAGSVRSIMVKAASPEAMPLVEKSVTALLRQRHQVVRVQRGELGHALHAFAAEHAHVDVGAQQHAGVAHEGRQAPDGLRQVVLVEPAVAFAVTPDHGHRH